MKAATWQRGLYAITDPKLTPPRHLLERVEAAIAGGAVIVQYRDKLSGLAEKHALASALLALCRRQDVPLIVNDDIDLAADIGADGVHLGRDDAPLADARARLRRGAIVGVSCYNEFERAGAAIQAGADYIAFGRFYPSQTKPGAVQADPELLQRARRWSVPVAAIGGIHAGNGAALVAAGADLLAVVDGVFGQADVLTAARGLSQLFDEGRLATGTD